MERGNGEGQRRIQLATGAWRRQPFASRAKGDAQRLERVRSIARVPWRGPACTRGGLRVRGSRISSRADIFIRDRKPARHDSHRVRRTGPGQQRGRRHRRGKSVRSTHAVHEVTYVLDGRTAR